MPKGTHVPLGYTPKNQTRVGQNFFDILAAIHCDKCYTYMCVCVCVYIYIYIYIYTYLLTYSMEQSPS